MGISHGVAWDNIQNKYAGDNYSKNWVIDAAKACDKIVSVDTNTANWFQTVDYMLGNMTEVVPNYVETDEFKLDRSKNEEEKIIILYPRRLYEPRGLYLVLDILDAILEKYSNVEIHFVGKGFEEDTKNVEEKIEKWGDRVKMYSLAPEKMHEAYKKATISLVPTLYSEGTSLSCLEAMATGNAVIATRIGGLTDIIINNYNGKLIEPNVRALYNAIEEFLDNEEVREKCRKNAVEVAKEFNKKKWKKSWERLIKENAGELDKKKNIQYNIVKIYITEDKFNDYAFNKMLYGLLTKNNIVYIVTDEENIRGKSFGRLQFIGKDQTLYKSFDKILADKEYSGTINEKEVEYI
ncbi:MAG: glycosyltransferase family 4 protein [Oscillospiraceae bacterium]|nr:glycosyltransferase family 4 protein [Oscillospiraceae bacterium]